MQTTRAMFTRLAGTCWTVAFVAEAGAALVATGGTRRHAAAAAVMLVVAACSLHVPVLGRGLTALRKELPQAASRRHTGAAAAVRAALDPPQARDAAEPMHDTRRGNELADDALSAGLLGLGAAAATSMHAALTAAPAAATLLAAFPAVRGPRPVVGAVLAAAALAAWAVAVCVRHNVAYGALALAVLLTLPQQHALASAASSATTLIGFLQ
jgi:hypothetical protein